MVRSSPRIPSRHVFFKSITGVNQVNRLQSLAEKTFYLVNMKLTKLTSIRFNNPATKTQNSAFEKLANRNQDFESNGTFQVDLRLESRPQAC
jgi:hypothetical protein